MSKPVLVESRFVSGSLATGRLVLTRDNGTVVRCGVLMCLGSFVDNGDGTVDVTFPG